LVCYFLPVQVDKASSGTMTEAITSSEVTESLLSREPNMDNKNEMEECLDCSVKSGK